MNCVQTIVDSEGAKVLYQPGWMDQNYSYELFSLLQSHIPWVRENITLRWGIGKQGRYTFLFSDPEVKHYKYSGADVKSTYWYDLCGNYHSDIGHRLVQIRDRLNQDFGVRYNSCMMNYFESGRDCIMPHSDVGLKDLGCSVTTISLGTSRQFVLQHISSGYTIPIMLHSGDLCVMAGTTQKYWKHSVPKDNSTTGRISLTWRQIKVD